MKKRIWLGCICILTMFLMAGCESPEPTAATVLNPVQHLLDFSAPTTKGTIFTPESAQGQPTVLFFGFTHCATICPITMATLAQFYERIKANPDVKRPKVMMVSVDPERDNLQALKRYTELFNKDFIGVRPNAETLAILLEQFHLISSKQETESGYQMDHSGQILLLDRFGRWQALFSNKVSVDELVHDYKLLAK